MRPGVRALLLVSDTYSPMAAPHGLPALHWPRLAAAMLEKEEGDGGHMHAVAAIEDRLRQGGWDPQWRFGMYSQAHYHSTTHELLTVVQAGATIQLGGTDSRAKPPPAPAPQGGDKEAPTSKTVELQAGDVLLLPAGYTHRAVHSRSGFTMIGSYPAQAEEWDSEYEEGEEAAVASTRLQHVSPCANDARGLLCFLGHSAISQRDGLPTRRREDQECGARRTA